LLVELSCEQSSDLRSVEVTLAPINRLWIDFVYGITIDFDIGYILNAISISETTSFQLQTYILSGDSRYFIN